jgi:hypothetical protein
VIDLDPQTMAVLRGHRAELATISLSLARGDAPVLGRIDGEIRHPERFNLAFKKPARPGTPQARRRRSTRYQAARLEAHSRDDPAAGWRSGEGD